MTRRDLEHRLALARLWAAARQPYLAAALFATSMRLTDGCDTIAVDRSWNLHADPRQVEPLEVPDLGAMLLHLVGHLLRDHADRAEVLGVEADDQRGWWNRCTDAEINDDLVLVDIRPTLAPDLPADLGVPAHGLAEQAYEQPPVGGRRWDCGSGCDHGDRPWDESGLGRQERELLRLDVAAEVQREHGREPGSVPGGWLRWAEAVLPAQVDWRRALAATVRRALASSAGRVDHTYRRPSRRQDVFGDVILPALHRPTPDVAIVCDTSGSMHDDLLARALAEVEGILTRAGLRQGHVRVLAVDTNVHAVRRVTRAADVELAGGGGTDMGEGIRAAVALRPRPSIVVVLTDGFTPWPAAGPKAVSVVVALLHERGWPAPPAPPTWARAITVTEARAS